MIKEERKINSKGWYMKEKSKEMVLQLSFKEDSLLNSKPVNILEMLRDPSAGVGSVLF